MIEFLSALFWGVLVLSLLVGVHEGGHFIAARAFGVRVTEFMLGLPSRFKLSFFSKRFGSEFGITPILLGGYNRICGMESAEGVDEKLLPKALACVQEHGRVEVSLLAQELAIDEEQAYALLATLADWAAIQAVSSEEHAEGSEQTDAALMFETIARDEALLTPYDSGYNSVQGIRNEAGEARPVQDAEAFLEHERTRTYVGCSYPKRLAILLAGPLVNLVLAFLIVVSSLMIVGVEYPSNVNVLGSVQDGSLAEAAGLKEGDTLVAIGQTYVGNWNAIVKALDEQLAPGQELVITYIPQGEETEKTVSVTPPAGEEVTLFGISCPMIWERLGFIEACEYALGYAAFVASFALRLLMPQHTMEVLESSSSVVGISAMASEAASAGPDALIIFIASISMSLGCMNLLPIPPLDGGKIVIETIQALIRRPIPLKLQNALSYLGLAFFLFIFIYAVGNDIGGLLG